MKTPENFNPTPSSIETAIQEIKESLADLYPPGDAQYIQLYQSLASEHQQALQAKQQEIDDLTRRVMTNVHLILSLDYPDDHSSVISASAPPTIRALIQRHDGEE
ncbi:hypothetical protein ABF87_08000 [Nitrosomonas sp. JL21]|uniref:hypothetical protein n=1 Tax=Nitrosomonas sp. JL21 TaxID=153949 RepID=UPI00136E3336|nr:hypothetical protein [Nitrosomonas sp. JL21]MXS77906.1 hypothetical protein [Nitrosomonas sp. JL21]